MEDLQWNINSRDKMSIFLIIKDMQIKARLATIVSLLIFFKGYHPTVFCLWEYFHK